MQYRFSLVELCSSCILACCYQGWCANVANVPLQQHTNEVFVIETHPKDPRVFVSAGHDGIIVIWDMFKGDKLNQFKLNVSFMIVMLSVSHTCTE